ncbi:mechanosensitive ion channel family protein [Campylobacter sp. CCS1377]|uniref:Mechanosensitive ion channel family protein n=1 Tax=Campylobacter sp. CCS1377 TaxID=3158229 RepID=A0AAU7E830_9BACT|nr:mechanosensitive ion channel family protein [Campylobacter jejuni]
MKKIFLILVVFVCVLFSQELKFFDANKSNANEKTSYSLVEKYVLINEQIKDYQEQEDANVSLFSGEIKVLEKQKQNILVEIPSVIVTQKTDENAVNNFLKIKKSIENKIKKNKNNPSVYVDSSLDLIYLNLVESFYSSFIGLEQLFKDAAQSSSIEKSIDQSIGRLQKVMVYNFDEMKSKITDESILKTLEEKEEKLKDRSLAYQEILSYLRTNASLLESNYLFSKLGLQNWIDKINQIANFESINLGKIVISALVLLIFFSLRKFFSHIVYFVLVKLFYKSKENLKDIKAIFIEHIQKPVGILLLVYAASICFTIIYYPTPVSIKITNLFYIAYAILIAWLILTALDSYGVILVSKLAQKSGKKEVVNLIIKILYFLIIVVALLFVLAQLGFNVSALVASLGIGGLAVALAAKDIIANFFASVLLLFDNSFNQGDWVEISGVEGTIVETGLRKTTIRTFDNSLVFLPNSTIMGANIKNWSKRRIGRHVKMYIGVTYGATPEQLESCIKDLKELLNTSDLVAHADDSALKYGDHRAKYRQNLVSINDLEGYKNACYVALSDFGDNSINIELYFYTKAIDAAEFRESKQILMLEFMRIVEKNGLSFAFPSRSIYIENLPKINLSK